ncbi:hypothetical protein [Sulfuricella sp. T08]|uniref:hypothetical protein n=1 Tax=Sulfuricella sp. T08 TaxID=1632857 RepID=UPI001186917E|nr:hypothetical protein [Sulfuricella sp. T08]
MTNISASDTEQNSDAAKTAASTATPKSSTSDAKTTAKPTSKPAVKHAAKAPNKAAANTGKAATNQETAKKGDAGKTDKKVKPKKAKQVRDSFTMPKAEYDLIAAVKKRCVAKGLAVKKSEVLRAAVIGFAAQSDAAVSAALQSLEVIKTGRPPKGQK